MVARAFRVRGRRQIPGRQQAFGLVDDTARAVIRVKLRCAMAIHGPCIGLASCIPAPLDAGVLGAARPSMDSACRYDALAGARPQNVVPIDTLVVVVHPMPPTALLGGRCPWCHSRCGHQQRRGALRVILVVALPVVLGKPCVSHSEPPLQLLHLPFERLVLLRLRGRRGQRLAESGPRAGAVGAAASATAPPTPSALGAASTLIGPRIARPSRGCRAAAIAAAMATMEGCSAAPKAFARSLVRALPALRAIECGKAMGSWARRE